MILLGHMEFEMESLNHLIFRHYCVFGVDDVSFDALFLIECKITPSITDEINKHMRFTGSTKASNIP